MDKINVLWIEDDPRYMSSFIPKAKLHGIEFTHFTNWESAKRYLSNNMDEVHAVLFDAHCKTTENDTAGNHEFLHYAVIDMLLIFAKYHTVRPWYILSAGTMDRFNETITIVSRFHRDYESEWGPLLYKKKGFKNPAREESDGDDFANADANSEPSEKDLIAALTKAVKHPNNAMFRHIDTLQYLGTKGLFKGSARSNMLALLNALYQPQLYKGYRFQGNPIRKVFESIVHGCVECGIIPEDIRPGGNVQCKEASRFLSGANPERLSKRFGKLNERILDSTETNILLAILASSNVASHESSEDLPETDIVLTDDNRDEFAGCALLMCRIIKAVGKYIVYHPNIDNNKAQWMPNPGLLEGKEFEIRQSGGILHAEDCILPNYNWITEGNKIILKDVIFNENDTSDEFPFYCKNPQTPKRRNHGNKEV